MSNLWGYILDATIYGSITGFAIFIINVLLKNKLNRKYAYLLWMILIIKLIIPFGPESNISLFNKIPVKINQNSAKNEVILDKGSNYNKDDIVVNYYESESSEKISQEDILTNEINNSTINKKVDSLGIFANIIPLVWISGVAITLITYLIIYLYFIKNLRKKEKTTYLYLDRALENCKDKLHIKRKIQIVVDDTINSPSVIGIFKIRIILPSSLLNLSEEELKHIFLHELCHYKRKDNLVDNILVLLQSLHWFNPIIWYLFKQIRNDMEMACDEKVLSVLNENEHNNYGLTMLTVLEKVNFNKKFSIGLNIAGDKKTLKKRVEFIKNSKYFSKKKKIFTVTGIICLVIMSGILLTNGVSEHKDNNSLGGFDVSSNDLDEAISKSIIEVYLSNLEGELPVESHEILGKSENEDYVEVYLMTTYGIYEFQNNIFNLTTAMSNIPMKIKFTKKDNQYNYVDSKIAEDGGLFEESLYEMFPKKQASQALNNSLDGNYSKKLLEKLNKKAEYYVKNLGREAQVTYNYVPKKELNEVALKGMSGIEELYNYPQYIGTREVLESGTRYIYETAYNERTGILSFYKYKENKETSNIIQYKVNKDNIEKIDMDNLVLYSKENAPVFIDENTFKITVNSISVIDNKAEYYVSIFNKSNEKVDLKLDKINIGNSSKDVNFRVQLEPSENIYTNLIIEDVSDISELNDKIHGSIIVNSREYNFIYK